MKKFFAGLLISSFVWIGVIFFFNKKNPEPEGELTTVHGRFELGISWIYIKTKDDLVRCEFPKTITTFEICRWIHNKTPLEVKGRLEWWSSGEIRCFYVEKVKQSL